VDSFDLTAVVGLTGVPIVAALVQLVKLTFPSLDSRWWPAVSFAVALALNVGAAFALGKPIGIGAAWGILAGLSASGLYTWVRARTAT
jgi:hypothetical protein